MVHTIPMGFGEVECQFPDVSDCKYIVLDVETTGLSPYHGDQIFGVAVATKHGSWFLPVRMAHSANMDIGQVFSFIRSLAEDSRRVCLFYNAPFDMSFFRREGVEFPNKVIDVMVLAHVCNNRYVSVGLKDLARRLGFETEDERRLLLYKRANKITNYADFPYDVIAPYAKADAALTYDVFRTLYPRLDEDSRSLFEWECVVTKALFEMESAGMRVDLDYLYSLGEAYLARMHILERELADVGISPTENATIASYIVKNNIPIVRLTRTGMVATDEDSLSLIDDDNIRKVLEYRGIRKLHSTYVVNLLREHVGGIVHFDYRQTGTVTGRFSGNSQQFPKKTDEIRRAFIPREGNAFIVADYSGQEIRLFAHYAGDERIVQAYKEDKYYDFHQMVADRLGISRQVAKAVSFSIIYGAGVKRLAAGLKCSQEQAERIRENYYKEFPTIRRLQRAAEDSIHRDGYVRNVYGRRLYIDVADSYKAINYLIQSSGADMMKRSLARIYRERPSDLLILFSVHDELGFECPVGKVLEYARFVKECMEDYETFSVPMVVEVGVSTKSWADKEKLDI